MHGFELLANEAGHLLHQNFATGRQKAVTREMSSPWLSSPTQAEFRAGQGDCTQPSGTRRTGLKTCDLQPHGSNPVLDLSCIALNYVVSQRESIKGYPHRSRPWMTVLPIGQPLSQLCG